METCALSEVAFRFFVVTVDFRRSLLNREDFDPNRVGHPPLAVIKSA